MGRKERFTGYWRKLMGPVRENKRVTDTPVQGIPDDRYYEDLVNGLVPAQTGFNKTIQRLTKKDAGVVLAMIGMDHPAAGVVYRYLVQQKCGQYGDRCGYLLLRKRIMRDSPSEKSHSQVSDPRDPVPVPGRAF